MVVMRETVVVQRPSSDRGRIDRLRLELVLFGPRHCILQVGQHIYRSDDRTGHVCKQRIYHVHRLFAVIVTFLRSASVLLHALDYQVVRFYSRGDG